jgi:DNA-directed RNA polymerase subunit RPC12/RpoP
MKYTCHECKSQFTEKGSLAKHKQAIHQGQKKSCRECDFQANSMGTILQHQQAIHDGQKLTCQQCNSKFVVISGDSKHFPLKEKKRIAPVPNLIFL